MLYAAAVVYACSTGWCINVFGSVEADSADACVARMYKEMGLTSGYPACFIAGNNYEAHILSPALPAKSR